MKRLLSGAILGVFLFCGCGTGSEQAETTESPQPSPKAETPQQPETQVAEKSAPEPALAEPPLAELPKSEPPQGEPAAKADASSSASTTEPATVKNPLDLSYITDDYEGAVILHPSHLLSSQLLLELLKLDPNTSQAFDKAMSDGQENTGVDPRKIKQVIILIDKQLAARNPATLVPGLGGGAALETRPEIRQVSDEKDKPKPEKEALQKQEEKGLTFPDEKPGSVSGADADPDFGDLPDAGPPPSPSVIIRFTEPQDEQALLAKSPAPATKKEYQGKTIYSFGEMNAHFPDKSTLLLGRESLLQKMVTTKTSESLLLDRLAKVDAENDVIVVMDLSGHRKQIEAATENVGPGTNPMLVGLIGLASKVKTLTLTIGLSGESLLNLALQAYDEESAKQIGSTIEGLIGFGKLAAMGSLDQAKNGPSQLPPGTQPLIPLAEDLLGGITVTTNASESVLNVKTPEDFENLPELLKPLVQKKSGAEDGTSEEKVDKKSE